MKFRRKIRTVIPKHKDDNWRGEIDAWIVT